MIIMFLMIRINLSFLFGYGYTPITEKNEVIVFLVTVKKITCTYIYTYNLYIKLN